nr:Integrator complex subunit like [Ipomoea batatas]
MGQAFRRAAGRIGSSGMETSSSQLKKPIERPPPPPPEIISAQNVGTGAESTPKVNLKSVLEERDPQFDVMLSQMVGRIHAKPGGKLEMGEGSVVEKYDRPLPKLRNTTTESSRYEGRPAPPGTLNVAQIRQIIMLYQGKSNEHKGPMDVNQIANKFRIDVSQVQSIVQFVSLPPEDTKEQKKF